MPLSQQEKDAKVREFLAFVRTLSFLEGLRIYQAIGKAIFENKDKNSPTEIIQG